MSTQFILSTTHSFQHPTLEIEEYKGIATGETVIGANIVRDLFASIRDVVGGRSGSYEEVLREAKNTAIEEMKSYAIQLGGNAVIGIDLDYETIGQSMLMVTASGTAVKLRTKSQP